MGEAQNAQGICLTCRYRSECLSLRNSLREGRTILQCEEFASFETKWVDGARRGTPPTNQKNAENGCFLKSVEESGLCANCANSRVCNYPCFGKKVIYCEEYVVSFPKARKRLPLPNHVALFSIPNCRFTIGTAERDWR